MLMHIRYIVHSAIYAAFVLSAATVCAQESTEWRDSLNAATVTADMSMVTRSIEKLETGVTGMRGVVSPLGEGDLIRWAQTLPGVTTGADGSSAIYVRGGNMGNNLVTVDGVPVYGYSHLLGLTTIVPSEIISTVSLSKGGFEGGTGNFTASHLAISTRDVSTEKIHASVALNNFLASASIESPIRKNMSILFSGRISPLTLEYKALRGKLPDMLDVDGFSAGVGDACLKYKWNIGSGRSLTAFGLYSMDSYGFSLQDSSNEHMGWQNMIGAVTYRSGHMPWTDFEAQVSMNMYSSSQVQEKEYRGVVSELSLLSEMNEAVASLKWNSHLGAKRRFSLDYGLKGRYAAFRPGQVASVTNESCSILASAYLQAGYEIPDRFSIKAGVTGNCFWRTGDNYQQEPWSRFDPDFNAAVRFHANRHIAFEATFDRISQYYHTLEGLPVGWSLDLLVPSGSRIAPETAMQGNAGTILTFGNHTASAGGFYKKMDGLVYYKHAETLFSGALAAWEDNVDTGEGESYGAEFLYEYQKDDLYARVSYTLSNTTRFNFAEVNEGRPFNAKFNRRHVLNATAQWKGFSASFIYQSGHWENGAAQKYVMHIPGEEWEADWYAGVNNFQMPAVIRLDLGYRFRFTTGDVRHEVNLGVCNVTNHFNPFMLYFDTTSESWKQLALLPILPNFSWKVAF